MDRTKYTTIKITTFSNIHPSKLDSYNENTNIGLICVKGQGYGV